MRESPFADRASCKGMSSPLCMKEKHHMNEKRLQLLCSVHFQSSESWQTQPNTQRNLQCSVITTWGFIIHPAHLYVCYLPKHVVWLFLGQLEVDQPQQLEKTEIEAPAKGALSFQPGSLQPRSCARNCCVACFMAAPAQVSTSTGECCILAHSPNQIHGFLDCWSHLDILKIVPLGSEQNLGQTEPSGMSAGRRRQEEMFLQQECPLDAKAMVQTMGL